MTEAVEPATGLFIFDADNAERDVFASLLDSKDDSMAFRDSEFSIEDAENLQTAEFREEDFDKVLL
jgi:hypothetical protein